MTHAAALWSIWLIHSNAPPYTSRGKLAHSPASGGNSSSWAFVSTHVGFLFYAPRVRVRLDTGVPDRNSSSTTLFRSADACSTHVLCAGWDDSNQECPLLRMCVPWPPAWWTPAHHHPVGLAPQHCNTATQPVRAHGLRGRNVAGDGQHTHTHGSTSRSPSSKGNKVSNHLCGRVQ